MFTSYPQSRPLLNPTSFQHIKHKLIRYRIQICCFLAVFIVLFSVFGLSSEDNSNTATKPEQEVSNSETPIKRRPVMLADSQLIPLADNPEGRVENLIILPCHAIYAPELNQESTATDENDEQLSYKDANNWLMEPFQLESDDHLSFFKHLELSFNELHENVHNSALVISGGYTKAAAQKSESASYLQLAESIGYLKHPYFVKGTNVLLDEYARDSYENVLYSICTFYKKFNKLPKKITIVGFGFKKERFFSSHLTTLGYYTLPNIINDEVVLDDLPDTKHAKYVGAGPFVPFDNSQFWSDLQKNEKIRALDLFKSNPFGSYGSLLHDKKSKRDPWNKHSEVSTFFTTDNEILNTLVELDTYEIKDAWNLYMKKVLPNFPLFEQ